MELPCATIAKEEKVVKVEKVVEEKVSRQGDGDSVLGHCKTYARRLPGLWH